MEKECSKICGGGFLTLRREVISGNNCDRDENTRTEHCNEHMCPNAETDLSGKITNFSHVNEEFCLKVI